MKNVAIILAGGRGNRFGANIPKQFVRVNNRPIIAYTIEKFQQHNEIDAIQIVCRSGYQKDIREICDYEGFDKVQWIAEGGEDFYHSVENGLLGLENEINLDDQVLIHYGVSPMTHDKTISDSIAVCKRYGNAIAAHKQVYLVTGYGDGHSTSCHVNREEIMAINSPQVLNYELALKTIRKIRSMDLLAKVEPYLTSLMLELGESLWFSYDTTDNIKITTPEDLQLFEGWLLSQRNHEIKGN